MVMKNIKGSDSQNYEFSIISPVENEINKIHLFWSSLNNRPFSTTFET